MIRFFVNNKLEHTKFITLDKERAQQLRKVLRVKVGEKIELFNKESLRCTAEITKLLRESCDCKILETEKIEEELDFHVNIFQSLPRNTKLEFLVQKCTELGVKAITFFKSDRSVVKVNIDSENKLHRLQKVAEEAAEQCGRYSVPEIRFSPNDVDNLLTESNCYFLQKGSELTIKNINKSGEINVLIGPEGGFSEREIVTLNQKAKGINLSKFTLRSETAPIVFLAQISL